MKKTKLFLLTLLSLFLGGVNAAWADTVSGYTVDFESPITTSNHDFAVASNWGHVVDVLTDRYGDSFWMSYSYYSDEGVDGSGTLLAYRQYAYDQSSSSTNKVTYDLLVTPIVKGEVTLQVKGSISASTNNPAFVEFYSLNDAGTARETLLQRFDEDISTSEWTTISINVSEAQKIGIRAQYAYLDNFTAQEATIVAEKKLTIVSVSDVNGASTTYFNQQEDGTILAQYNVVVKNTGDVDLNPGDDNYTLSLFNRYSSDVKYGSFEIPVSLASGVESSPILLEISLPSSVGTGWKYWDVVENISGTTCQGKWVGINSYESKFIFDVSGTTYYGSSSATTTPIAFGKIAETTTLNYEIYNAGSAPLVINSISVPEGFTTDAPTGEFTVAAGEKKQIAISLLADNPGIFAGNVTIVYTNFGKTQATYTLGISGTIVDPTKNLITFDNGENGQFPAGSIHSDQVYIAYNGEAENYYLISTSTTTKFITPLLHAEAGESFTYDSWYSSYDYNAAIVVYTSTDRINWTQIDKQTYTGSLGSSAKTFTVTIDEAGDYYLAFELIKNALLDNIYGLTLADTPDHDWYVAGSDIPTTGKQNTDYTATISLKNISASADIVESATLYVGGEAVAVVENTNLDGNPKTAAVGTGRNGYANIEDPQTISLTYKPHTFGTLSAYIEVKSGNTVVKTNEVDVVIAEEKVENDVSVEGNTTTSFAPMYGTWMDATGGSFSDFYFTKEQLEEYGIKEDDVITAITFAGSPSSTKTINSLSAKAWVGMESLDGFTVGNPDKENMTEVTLFDSEKVEFVYGVTKEIKIDLSENPIVYDGSSIIHIFTNFDGNGSYINVSFPADSNYPNAWYGYGASPSWTKAAATPVASFSLAVEPTYYTGTVKAGNEAIEGATVTIRNDENDIEYFGTTDAEGAFKITVVQDKLEGGYVATVTADGYDEYTAAVTSFTEGNNYVLTPLVILAENATSIEEATNVSVKIERTFKAGWNAIILPINISADELAAIDANYELAEYVGDEGTDAVTVEFKDVTNGIVAGVPYLLYLNEAVSGLKFQNKDVSTTTSKAKGTVFDFVGVYSNTDVKAGDYFVKGGEFVKATVNNKVLPFRSYLQLKESANAARSISFVVNNEVTGLENLTIEPIGIDGIYNLQGQKVEQLKKGNLYIINGKKVLVK